MSHLESIDQEAREFFGHFKASDWENDFTRRTLIRKAQQFRLRKDYPIHWYDVDRKIAWPTI